MFISLALFTCSCRQGNSNYNMQYFSVNSAKVFKKVCNINIIFILFIFTSSQLLNRGLAGICTLKLSGMRDIICHVASCNLHACNALQCTFGGNCTNFDMYIYMYLKARNMAILDFITF